MLIEARPEVLNDQVCLHLELCERAFEILLAAFAKAALLLHLVGVERGSKTHALQRRRIHVPHIDACRHEKIHQELFAVACLAVFVARVKVVAVAPVICKVRKPFFRDEPGTASVELAVSNFTGAGEHGSPLPGICGLIAAPPVRNGGHFLNREPCNIVTKERQEPDRLNNGEQFTAIADTALIVSVKALHIPLSVEHIHPQISPP